MQPSGLQHRKQAPALTDRPLEGFEITVLSTSQFGPEIIGSSLALVAGPLYTNAIMGQAPSAAEREHVRKASFTIHREDCIQVEESDSRLSLDLHSGNENRTYHTPHLTRADDNMMTQNSLLRVPKENSSRDLEFFLRTTGPAGTLDKRSGVGDFWSAKGTSKNALRFFKLKSRRTRKSKGFNQDQSPFDEGGLLANIPRVVEQKVSSAGKRYFALKEPSLKDTSNAECDDMLSPSILVSRVSVHIADSINPRLSPEGSSHAFSTDKMYRRRRTPLGTSSALRPADQETRIVATNTSPTPIRPPASDPPTPEPVSAISMDPSFQSQFADQSVNGSFDLNRTPLRHDRHPITTSDLSLPQASVSEKERLVTQAGEVDIKHPSPRRLASHAALLQRTSSIGSSEYRRSISKSPGPPPPRSPMRPRQHAIAINSTIESETNEQAASKVAPRIQAVRDYNFAVEPIKPSVVTDCTGPIKRPHSVGKNTTQSVFQISRREREERTRARKLRDRPISGVAMPIRTIDAIVNAPVPALRQRLRKARPHIQIPDLRPVPLTTRASSSASSSASWQKVTESLRTPVSAVPSEDTPTTNEEKTGYTPISPTASYESTNGEAKMAFSPVMLVAQEIPLPKAKSPSKTAKLIVRSYAPRPRSASIPRSAMKRRSGQGAKTPTTPDSPGQWQEQDSAPPLPSAPPNRALPPTPPASGSEKRSRGKISEAMEHREELPVLPRYEIAPTELVAFKRSEHAQHVATQALRKNVSSRAAADTSHLQARLEALERQNTLLRATLTDVLRTNGTLLGPLCNVVDSETLQSPPMAWESRIARRSAASHVASSSDGSALEMYINTRQGSNFAR